MRQIPWATTVTCDPGFMYRLGFRPNPTPSGVPVRNKSSGLNVTWREAKAIIWPELKFMFGPVRCAHGGPCIDQPPLR